jgi:hypothetical protein
MSNVRLLVSLVTLKRYLDSTAAEIARMKLEAEGIPAHLASAGFVALTGLSNALGGVELQVPVACESEARTILDQLERDLGQSPETGTDEQDA